MLEEVINRKEFDFLLLRSTSKNLKRTPFVRKVLGFFLFGRKRRKMSICLKEVLYSLSILAKSKCKKNYIKALCTRTFDSLFNSDRPFPYAYEFLFLCFCLFMAVLI